MTALAATNLAVRFLLELAALGALGWCGYHAAGALPARLALAVGCRSSRP